MRTLTLDGQVLDTSNPKCEHVIGCLYLLDGIAFKVGKTGRCVELIDQDAVAYVGRFGFEGLEAAERTQFKTKLYYHT